MLISSHVNPSSPSELQVTKACFAKLYRFQSTSSLSRIVSSKAPKMKKVRLKTLVSIYEMPKSRVSLQANENFLTLFSGRWWRGRRQNNKIYQATRRGLNKHVNNVRNQGQNGNRFHFGYFSIRSITKLILYQGNDSL